MPSKGIFTFVLHLFAVAAAATPPVEGSSKNYTRDKRAATVSSARRLGTGRWKEAKSLVKVVKAESRAGEAPTSTTRRITRGLGIFAGTDFPCDADRDAFVGAPWAKNACLLKCSANSRPNAPRCENAIAVCERLSHCATVDINVEASVATLKQESPLSARTSRVKSLSVTKSHGDRAAGVDAACSPMLGAVAEPCNPNAKGAGGRKRCNAGGPPHGHVKLRALGGRPTCLFDCPALNCTRCGAPPLSALLSLYILASHMLLLRAISRHCRHAWNRSLLHGPQMRGR